MSRQRLTIALCLLGCTLSLLPGAPASAQDNTNWWSGFTPPHSRSALQLTRYQPLANFAEGSAPRASDSCMT